MTPARPKRRSVFADKLGEFADFASGDDEVFARRGRWGEFFRTRIGEAFSGRIVLEIGCADAALLAAMAVKQPTVAFIGLDWKARQIYLGAQRVASAGVNNVALLRARAQDLNAVSADAEVDEILVFHPEPCDRPEELKNRLLDQSFLSAVHRVLRNGHSTMSLKTDHRDYFEWVAAQLGSQSQKCFETRLRSGDFWNDPETMARTATRCFAGEATPFERRFIRRRQPIYYLEFQKREA